MSSNEEKINHPAYYKTNNGLEVIDIIEALRLGARSETAGFNLGNAIKYISRAGVKDAATYVQDLEKGLWYLQREIANAEKKS